MLATDKTVLIPRPVPPKKAERISNWLRVKLVHTTIGGSVLIGALSSANSKGIVLPHFVQDDEIAMFRSVFGKKTTIMATRQTAYGNLVLANDYGAIVDPRFKKSERDKISEALDVEVMPGKIAGLPYIGSLAVATNKGVLAHPLLKASERKLLSRVLQVEVDTGTVNRGIPYVGTGLIGNCHSAVTSSLVTGPEIFIIRNALDVLNEDD